MILAEVCQRVGYNKGIMVALLAKKFDLVFQFMFFKIRFASSSTK